MAVFPSARRALAWPARLPVVIVAAALAATTLGLLGTSLFSEQGHDRDAPALVAESSSIVLQAEDSAATSLAAGVYQAAPVTGALPLEEQALHIPVVDPVADGVTEAGEPVALADGPAETAAAAPVSEAPGAPQPSVQAAPASPVERWAGAGIVIETEGQLLDDHSLANVNAALQALPASLLDKLGNPALGPLHILVNAEGRTRSGNQPYRGPANFFSTNEGTNELVLYPQQSVFTIVHELGHAYNLRNAGAGRYAMVLLDPEMRSFLAAVGWEITSTDEQIRAAVDHMHVAYTYNGSFHWPRVSNDDPLEDFANSFAMYFLDPEGLQIASPERYAWMAGVFGR